MFRQCFASSLSSVLTLVKVFMRPQNSRNIIDSRNNIDSRNALVADALVAATRASANFEFVFLKTTQG
jgi:hypothetical protein